MKTAVSSTGKHLASAVDPRFGRAPYFVIIEEEGGGGRNHYVVENPAASAATGAGTEAAQRMIRERVDAVISGAVGPNAFEIFEKMGVDVFLIQGEIPVEEAYRKFKENGLKKMAVKRL